MGTKVQNLPGYYSMRDLNDESSSCGWPPLFDGDKTPANGQYYHNYLPSAAADVCSAHDKDVVKQMMLEHEAIFKNQVFELHRLYRIQKDLMDEVKMKELLRNQRSVETSFSTGHLASQITSEDGKKWKIPGFPITGSSTCARPSISGVEGIHSPAGSNKGIGKQAILFPSPNGSSSRDIEVLESRPSKVRRKMFDLHLPADEYIDTEESEKLSDEKISGPATFLADRNCKRGKGGDVTLICGNAGKAGCHEDTSRCEQSLWSRNGLADLNEPVMEEETNDASYIPSLNHNPYQRASECSDRSAKRKFFGLSREDLLNSHHRTDGWSRSNGYVENNGSGKVSISSVETGHGKSNPKSKQEQSLFSSQTMQDALSKAWETTSDYPTDRSKADLWRERTVSCLEISERDHEYSTNKHSESVVSSHRPGPFSVSSSLDLVKSWSHSSLETGNSSLNQKLKSVQTLPFPCLDAFGNVSRGYQPQQSDGILGDSWPLNINSKPNSGLRFEASGQNGFYPRTSSGSKELSLKISSNNYDHLNGDNNCKKFPEHFNNGLAKSSNSGYKDAKSGKDIDLNVLLSNGSSNNLVTQSGNGIVDGQQKHGEQLQVLPWLRAKTACKNEAQNGGRSLTSGQLSMFDISSSSNKDESGKGSSGNFMQNVCSGDIEPRKTEVSESSSKQKILGVPIFDTPHISAKESSSLISPSISVPNPSDVELVEKNQKVCALDINLSCDDAVLELNKQAVPEIIVCEKGLSTTEANSRNQIDLNLSMSEEEASLTTIPTTGVKMRVEIDLEAPAVPETEEDAVSEEKKLETPLAPPLGPEDIVEQTQDELTKHVAEILVVLSTPSCNQVDDVISNPSESAMVDPLTWFADIVSSGVDDLQKKSCNSRPKDGENEEFSPEGMDYYEFMTLKLLETKEEDYMPKPFVPESFKVEDTGTTSLPTRTRKGPIRRGRQRRDFQRDILPGLVSLSRHEVTEDIQTFGGLMRATGHAWNSGLTRRSSSRNGSGRGRRRSQAIPALVATAEPSAPLLQQLNNIEVGLEERSLTGWGKTTRRPRRQRYPAGNPPSIRLI